MGSPWHPQHHQHRQQVFLNKGTHRMQFQRKTNAVGEQSPQLAKGLSQNNFSNHQHGASSLYCRARRKEALLVRVLLGTPGRPVVPTHLQ